MAFPVNSMMNSALVAMPTAITGNTNLSSVNSRLQLLLECLWLKRDSPAHLLTHKFHRTANNLLVCHLAVANFYVWIGHLATLCIRNFKEDELTAVVDLLEKQVFRCFAFSTEILSINISILRLQEKLSYKNLAEYLSFAYLKAHVFPENYTVLQENKEFLLNEENLRQWSSDWWRPQTDSSSTVAYSTSQVALNQRFITYLKNTAANSDWYRSGRIVTRQDNGGSHYLLKLEPKNSGFNNFATYLADFLETQKDLESLDNFICNINYTFFKIGIRFLDTDIRFDFLPYLPHFCAVQTKLMQIILQNCNNTQTIEETNTHKQRWLAQTIQSFKVAASPSPVGLSPQALTQALTTLTGNIYQPAILSLTRSRATTVAAPVQAPSPSHSNSHTSVWHQLQAMLEELWLTNSETRLIGHRLINTAYKNTALNTLHCNFKQSDFAALAIACLKYFRPEEINTVLLLLQTHVLRFISFNNDQRYTGHEETHIHLPDLKAFLTAQVMDASVLRNALTWSCLRANAYLDYQATSAYYPEMDLVNFRRWQNQFSPQNQPLSPVSKLAWQATCRHLKEYLAKASTADWYTSSQVSYPTNSIHSTDPVHNATSPVMYVTLPVLHLSLESFNQLSEALGQISIKIRQTPVHEHLFLYLIKQTFKITLDFDTICLRFPFASSPDAILKVKLTLIEYMLDLQSVNLPNAPHAIPKANSSSAKNSIYNWLARTTADLQQMAKNYRGHVAFPFPPILIQPLKNVSAPVPAANTVAAAPSVTATQIDDAQQAIKIQVGLKILQFLREHFLPLLLDVTIQHNATLVPDEKLYPIILTMTSAQCMQFVEALVPLFASIQSSHEKAILLDWLRSALNISLCLTDRQSDLPAAGAVTAKAPLTQQIFANYVNNDSASTELCRQTALHYCLLSEITDTTAYRNLFAVPTYWIAKDQQWRLQISSLQQTKKFVIGQLHCREHIGWFYIPWKFDTTPSATLQQNVIHQLSSLLNDNRLQHDLWRSLIAQRGLFAFSPTMLSPAFIANCTKWLKDNTSDHVKRQQAYVALLKNLPLHNQLTLSGTEASTQIVDLWIAADQQEWDEVLCQRLLTYLSRYQCSFFTTLGELLSEKMSLECAATLLYVKRRELERLAQSAQQPPQVQARLIPCLILAQDRHQARVYLVIAGFNARGHLGAFFSDSQQVTEKWLQAQAGPCQVVRSEEETYALLDLAQLSKLKAIVHTQGAEPAALILQHQPAPVAAIPPASLLDEAIDTDLAMAPDDSDTSEGSPEPGSMETPAEKVNATTRKRKELAVDEEPAEDAKAAKRAKRAQHTKHRAKHWRHFQPHPFQDTVLDFVPPSAVSSAAAKNGTLPSLAATATLPTAATNVPAGLSLWQEMSFLAVEEIAHKVAREDARARAILQIKPLAYPIAAALAALPPSPPCPTLIPFLKSYQQQVFAQLRHHARHGIADLLALPMGFGKTCVYLEYQQQHIVQQEGTQFTLVPKSVLSEAHGKARSAFIATKQAIWQWELTRPASSAQEKQKLYQDFWPTLLKALEALDKELLTALLPLWALFPQQLTTHLAQPALRNWGVRYGRFGQLQAMLQAAFGVEACQPLTAGTALIMSLYTVSQQLKANLSTTVPMLEGLDPTGLKRLRDYDLTEIYLSNDADELLKHVANAKSASPIFITTPAALVAVNRRQGGLQKLTAPPCTSLVYDEAQHIHDSKGANYQALENFLQAFPLAPKRLLVTGTPIENDFTELWTLLSFANPGKFDRYTHDALAKLLDETKKTLIEEKNSSEDCLQALMHSFVQFYTFKSEVVQPLLIRLEPADISQDWHHAVPKRVDRILEIPLQATVILALEKLKQQFRQNKLDQFEFISHSKKVLWLPPGKTFKSFELKDIAIQQLLSLPDPELCAALNTSVTIPALLKAPGFASVINAQQQALCIVEHKSTLRLLQRAIQQHYSLQAPEVDILDGDMNSEQRQAVLRWFKTEQHPRRTKILCFTKATGGVGLDLPEAHKVFNLTVAEFNPGADKQAENRALRVGHGGEREIYRLHYNDAATGKGIFLQEHERVVRAEKQLWEDFFYDKVATPQEAFVRWCELMGLICYRPYLNDSKIIDEAAAKRTLLLQRIRTAEESVTPELLTRLLAQVSAQPTAMAAAIPPPLLVTAMPPISISAVAPVATPVISFGMHELAIIPLPMGGGRDTAIGWGEILLFSAEDKTRPLLQHSLQLLTTTPKLCDLVRKQLPATSLANLQEQQQATELLKCLDQIRRSSTSSNRPSYRLQIFEFRQERFWLLSSENAGKRTLRLYQKERLDASGKLVVHWDLLVRRQSVQTCSQES